MGHLGHALAVLALAGAASAEPWEQMTGAEIAAALTGRTLVYDSGWQEFFESGRTLYNAGRDSWGTWRVEGDRYCSQWPPSDSWSCYAMSRDAATGALRFIDPAGNATVGRLGE